MSCASATQTLAWAAATISGRASESRKAVARLIGKPTSVGSSGARLSLANGSPARIPAAQPPRTRARPEGPVGQTVAVVVLRLGAHPQWLIGSASAAG